MNRPAWLPARRNAPPGQAAPEALDAEARAWLVRLTSGRATTDDAEAFRRWQAGSLAHADAFARARAIWQGLEPALHAQAAEGLAAAEHAARQAAADGSVAGVAIDAPTGAWARAQAAAPTRPAWGRRAFLGAAAAGAAWAAVRPPWQLWPSALDLAADYRTGIGEQRSVALGEALTVRMNTRTSFNVSPVEAGPPVIEFAGGEAEIEARADAGYAEVRAGGGSILAGHARFNLRRTGGEVQLSCLAGSVQLRHPQGVVELGPDRQVRYDAAAIQPPVAVDAQAVASWRTGWLVFDRQPLATVVDEINRYRPGRLVLVDDQLGRRLVQGRFELARLADVELLIRDAYGVAIRPLGAGIVLLG